MKKSFGFLFATFLALVALSCVVLVGCNKQPQPQEDTSDPTLINSFETIDDIYSLTAIEIAPDDEYRLSLNTDKQYVSDGNASLSYTFAGGGSHLFCQYIADGKLPNLDASKLKSVSLDFFNSSDVEQRVTVSVTTVGGAALFSKQQTIAPNAKTTVTYDELGAFSYKKKANIGGFSFRFDVDSPVTIYVDNMRVELGAEDVPSIGFDEFVESIADVPTDKVTPDNFYKNVAFVDAVCYAEQLYDALADKNSVKADNVAKLQDYRKLAGGYGAVYSPRVDTDVVDKWEYGAGLTVGSDTDETYGAIWSIAVNAKRNGEQSFKFVSLDTKGFGRVALCVYNPTDFDLSYRISGGWQSFSAQVGALKSKQWTKITCNAAVVENDIANSLFLTVYYMDGGVRQSFEGVFLFSAIYGEPAQYAAQSVIDSINRLPNEEQIGLEHQTTINNILAAYDELSKSAKSAVDNYKRLENAANKISRMLAVSVDERIAKLVEKTISEENVLQLYEEMSRVYADISSLDDNVYDNITMLSALDQFKASIEEHLPQIVKQLVDDLPELQTADFPKVVYKLQQIAQLIELLDKEELTNVDTAKLESYKAASANYTLLYDFGTDGLSKVSTDTDFGNSWEGTSTVQVDYEYGNLMVCNVQSGHKGDYSRNAEFRIRATSVALAKYEKIVFYVYCPIGDALFRCYPANWQNPVDIKLKANVWNKIEVDSSLFCDGNLDGMFFLFIAPQGKQPVGEWKVSALYGYVDEQTTAESVKNFVEAVDSFPEVADLTLKDKAAVETATRFYETLKPYCYNYINARVLSKYKNAVSKMESLQQASIVATVEEKINTLSDNSNGKDVFEALYAYTALDKKIQLLVGSDVLSKLAQAVESNRLFPAAFDNEVKLFAENYDLPRDTNKVKVLCDIMDGLSDEVFNSLSTETAKILTDINKIAKKYSVAANVGDKGIENETYGIVYELTLTAEQSDNKSLILKLNKGVASGKNIVLYVYRPEGATDAFLYFAGQNNIWTSNEHTSVKITSDGWTRIEFSAEYLLNADWDTYWYCYLTDSSAEPQQGWLISEVYAYKA